MDHHVKGATRDPPCVNRIWTPPIGIIDAKDVLGRAPAEGGTQDLDAIARKVILVPDTQPLDG